MGQTILCAEAVRLPIRPLPRRVRLPAELLLQIVDDVVPQKANALLPASHPATKTLLSLTRTCHATHARAQKLIQERCVILDTRRRLVCFLRYVKEAEGSSALPQSARFPAHHVTAMYLSPFFRAEDDNDTASQVAELLGMVSASLRRLSIRMPSPLTCNDSSPTCVCRTLHKGFRQLRDRLEEFVCLSMFPGLELTTGGRGMGQAPPAGADIGSPLWPQLRRLSLFGVELDNERLWEAMAMMPQLTDVVLARPAHVGAVSLKHAFFDAGSKIVSVGEKFDQSRLLRLMMMDAVFDIREVHADGWEEIDPHDMMTVEVYEVPTSYYGDETVQQAVASWVTRGARSGQIWDWRGEVVVQR